ncbi:MAG: 5-oxoprolinase subunit PxpA [Gemmatimonadaceae bacterium]|nr:5-oxoprolinase subunit PxpA [Gemmatimonadaceae bacterium]
MTDKPLISIDINADLGEHDGDGYAADEAILDVVSSASIACGAHAGSLEVMRRTVVAASERGVSIGAHPGYPDREGFGRRDLQLGPVEMAASIAAQIELLSRCCDEAGARLRYVKPHGALYNRAARDAELAKLLAGCVAQVSESLVVLTLPGSELEREATARGLAVAREAFIDRAYQSDGALVPRDQQGAVIEDPGIAAARAVEIVLDGRVRAMDGSVVAISAQSLCMHGDSRNALATVRLARSRLEESGIRILPFAR